MKKSLLLLLSTAGPAAGFIMTPNPTKTFLLELHIRNPFANEDWSAVKEAEKKQKKHHRFKSRSLEDFQKDLEAGKVRHLFPVMFAKERVAKGQLRPSDIPYEQRGGGEWTNKDVNVGYVPSGMAVHEWHDIQRAEKKKQQSKNFAAFGPTSFKSRSLQGFQEDLEKGKTSHLFPAMFAKERVKKGLMQEEEVPYMQRLGSWDNSDVKGAKKTEWSDTDKKMLQPPSWLRRGLSP